jgi:hypothetical protein
MLLDPSRGNCFANYIPAKSSFFNSKAAGLVIIGPHDKGNGMWYFE